jgi:hypothetical protein
MELCSVLVRKEETALKLFYLERLNQELRIQDGDPSQVR